MAQQKKSSVIKDKGQAMLSSWRDLSQLRQMKIWRGIAIVILLLFSFSLLRGDGFVQGDFIARMAIEGIIFDDSKRNQALIRFGKNDQARALIVHLNTGGGTAVGGEALYHQLRALAQDKPVVIVMHEIAASAGYMAALGGSHILARELTITGSIGAIAQNFNIEDMLGKIGIKPELFKSGALKATPNPFEKVTPEARALLMKEHIDETRSYFLNLVKEERGLSQEVVQSLAAGQTISGKHAYELGLIDGFGGEREALSWLEAQDGSFKDMPVRNLRIYPYDWDTFFEDSAFSFITHGFMTLLHFFTLHNVMFL